MLWSVYSGGRDVERGRYSIAETTSDRVSVSQTGDAMEGETVTCTIRGGESGPARCV